MSKIQHLYFITDARRVAVKIGVACDPERRLVELQSGNHTRLKIDLVLHFEAAGDANRYEDALHQQFAAHWRHREWFTYAPEIKEFVAAWNRGDGAEVLQPEQSCKRAITDYGIYLRKEDYMAILRERARR